MNSTTESTLNSFLRTEMSGAETYRQAIAKLENPSHPQTLLECQHSHERRAEMLRRWIQQHGGKPSESSGLYGTYRELVEAGAALFGEKTAIGALQSGEESGLKEYRRDVKDLEPDARQFVEKELLPEQARTCDAVCTLKDEL